MMFERAALGRDNATQLAEFQIDRNVREALAGHYSTLSAARELSTAISEVRRAFSDGPLVKAIRDITASVNVLAEQQRVSFFAINETIERSLGSYRNAFRIAESIGLGLAKQQQDIVAAFAQLPTSQTMAMARMFEGLDVGDWDDFEELDEFPPDVVHSRVLEILLAVLSSVNPANWGPGEYLAILLFIVAWNNPDFTEEDRQRLAEFTEVSKFAADHAEDAAEGIREIQRAEAARRQYLDYVSELPSAEIIGRGNVREAPKRGAQRISVLPQGAAIAIIDRQGRWLKVIYRDQLTNELAEGWLWRPSVEIHD